MYLHILGSRFGKHKIIAMIMVLDKSSIYKNDAFKYVYIDVTLAETCEHYFLEGGAVA